MTFVSWKARSRCVSYMNWQPRSWLWHERKLLRAFHRLFFFFVFTNSRISPCTIPSWLWQTTRGICTKFTLTATKREIRSTLGYKESLVAKLLHRHCTTSSIGDVYDLSRAEMESPGATKQLKKKLHQMDPKLVASQLVLIDSEMLRKIKLERWSMGWQE